SWDSYQGATSRVQRQPHLLYQALASRDR
ncbi:unnamed protein product, partial [Caretta caretta]